MTIRASVCIALCICLTGSLSCKTTPKTAPDAPEAAPQINAEALPSAFPMELPPHTAGLLSVDLGRTNIALNRMITMLPPHAQKEVQRKTSPSPAFDIAMDMFTELFGNPLGISQQGIVNLVDPAGKLHVAMSFQGSKEFIEALRLGAPLSEVEQTPHGLLLRISLPALDPPALRRELQMRAAPGHVERIEIVGSQVELDLRINSANATRMARGLEPIDIDMGSDADYLRATSPAIEVFLASDAAIKIHAPSASLTTLAAFEGLNQARQAIAYTPPENWERMRQHGLATVFNAFIFDDPTRYEVQDTTLLMDLSTNEHISMSMVRSLTPHGATMTSKLSAHQEQPTTSLPNALFSATMNHDFSAIQADIAPAREALLHEDSFGLTRDGGGLAFMARVIHSPMTTRSMMLSDAPKEVHAGLFAHAMHITGSSPSLEDGIHDAALTIDMVLPSPRPSQTSTLASDWKSVTSPIPITRTLIEGSKVKMTAGKRPAGTTMQMAALPQDTFAKASLDLAAISKLMSQLPAQMQRDISPTMLSELTRLSTVNLSATTSPTHTLWHAQTGEDDLTPTITTSAREVTQPGGHPDCLIPIIKTSRDAVTSLARSTDRDAVPTLMIDQVPGFHTSCPVASAQIDLIHARWLVLRAQSGSPDSAKVDNQSACELGFGLACELLAADVP